MNEWPDAQIPFIGSVSRILAVVQMEIEVLGCQEAYALFLARNDQWFEDLEGTTVDSQEEHIAMLAFGAGLAFVNLLFVTGEVCNDPQH